MRLIYFDESGTGSLANDPVTIVAAVPIHGDNEWSEIDEYAASIVENLVPEKNRLNFEFHATELFQGSRANRSWGLTRRWDVLDAFLEIFDKFNLPILWGGADRTNTMALFPEQDAIHHFGDDKVPHAIAFVFCQVQVELWFRQHAPNEKGICIVDPVSKKYVNKLLEEFQRMMQKGLLLPEVDFKLSHIIEAISFVDSRKSIGVQLSDACNFFIKRHESGTSNAGAERFYTKLGPHLATTDAHVFPPQGILDKILKARESS